MSHRRDRERLEASRQYELDHPVREDLTPVVQRMQDALMRLSGMRERRVLHGETPAPLLKAAAEGAVAQAKAELARAAADHDSKGIRVPMMPGSNYYVSITAGAR